MIFVALSEAADRGQLLLVQDGMCRFHLRRDGVVVIREILVLPFRQRTGVGRSLVDRVRGLHPDKAIQARCPVKYAGANAFWLAMGFQLLETLKGDINLWLRLP